MPAIQMALSRNYPNPKLLRNLMCYLHRSKSSLRLWEEDVNTEIKLKIEKHWSNVVLNQPSNNFKKKTHYILPMFPYPSGNLHMGHVRVYSISDTLARFQQLNGKNCIHPIGWDAFGLPAENAAIERNIPPHTWTETNINSMKTQLQQLGFNFNWEREISTCDPSYYKWTQFIFLKLFEKGLAYQSKEQVNWDPVDKTVLADEQVDDLGCSWRSGAKVEKKYLTQWFIKTTKFAKDLFDGLDSEELENWKDIINLQKHWIGECDGVSVTFKLSVNNQVKTFDVWTSEPYKFIHGNFLTMSPRHPLIHELKCHMSNSLTCHNPVTNRDLPIYITDDAIYPIGKDVSIACSIFDTDDNNTAVSLNIPVSNEQYEINVDGENQKAINIAINKNVGGHFVSSKLKDWLISRQRYWGTPIPIVHCEKCGVVPVPYEELPVQLPKSDSHKSGIQTLDKIDEWVNCKCPKCQSNARRETDTMDTFVDSSWYYYRFLDPANQEMPFSVENVRNQMPVDIYIGGKEHAVLHLYYARFMSYFFNSLGWTPKKEPFKKLVVQGMVMGQSYKLKTSGKYVPPEQVEKVGNEYKEISTGELVLTQWEKMSKSKYNGENPERLLSTYGCDTTRLLILADVPPATPRRWSDATLPGVLNWQHRLWMTIREFLKHRNNNVAHSITSEEFNKYERKIWESRNYFIATTTYHYKYTQKLSVGISRLQSLTSVLRNKIPPEVVAKSKEFERALSDLIIMLAPVTPHFCSELWAGFLLAPNRICDSQNIIDWSKTVLEQKWPKVDDDFELSFLCKVDGADRCELKIKARDLSNLSHEKALQIMLNEDSVKKRLKTDIHRTKFELYPDCRAILHIFPKKKQKVAQVDEGVA
ncbi:probable leucine--tRNA ligase, mitochondrial [Trichoplusia ni]|uniref:leucine--tRNA ligase n=1 Tax=Trichoplusia ni TaxID=7111 RepID=A0A7E5VSN7_TRINI|nr:probable leucine--tRNA ligase, mitochondrial [Trichoplusia ni]